MIPVSLYDTISNWHSEKMPRREIARRLRVDVKTVRRTIKKLEAGVTRPTRYAPASKLAPFHERIRAMVEAGRTAASIHTELQMDASFTSSYTIIKRYVADIKAKNPKIYERLEHLPGAELQIDFGELLHVIVDGRKIRTWALVGVYTASRYRFSAIVLEQSIPAFLSALQQGIRASGAVAKCLTIDNFKSAVMREQFKLRAYQRDFAAFCAHYGMTPNAVRPYTPTDKGMVENAVKTLKNALKGASYTSLSELKELVAEKTRLINDRVHSTTHRKPSELFSGEPRHLMPEVFPIGIWTEHRVRSDCHIQVLYNYYSVPYSLVGKHVTVRRDVDSIAIFDAFVEIARHDLLRGKGGTRTDRSHYPTRKQPTVQERRDARLFAIRSAGAGVAGFLSGLQLSGDFVMSDQLRRLEKLVNECDNAIINRACARAMHFGNYSVAALQTIIDNRLFELPLDDLSVKPVSLPPAHSSITIVRSLSAYAELLGGL